MLAVKKFDTKMFEIILLFTATAAPSNIQHKEKRKLLYF